MIENNDLSIEKLSNVNNDTAEHLCFILNDLLNHICLKSDSAIATSHHHYLDDDFNLLDPVLLHQSMANPFPNNFQNDARRTIEHFNRKLQVLDDPNYIREFKNILESKAESLIPPDKIRLISSINEGSQYLAGIKFNAKKLKINETLAILNTELEKLIESVDTKRQILESVQKCSFFYQMSKNVKLYLFLI